MSSSSLRVRRTRQLKVLLHKREVHELSLLKDLETLLFSASNTRNNNLKKDYFRPTASKVSVQGCFIQCVGQFRKYCKATRVIHHKTRRDKGDRKNKGKGEMRKNKKKEENKSRKEEERGRRKRE